MSSSSGSQVFSPYRAIGICSNHVPLVGQRQGSDAFVVTAVGMAFHVYLSDKLRLIFVGPQQPHPLQCLAISGKVVFASYRSTIKAFRRGQEVHCYHGHEGDVHTLVLFGEHLVAIDEENCLKLWHIKTQELYSEVHFPVESFQVTCALHPATYLNKLLLGSSQGQLQLWNLRTSSLIFTFKGWGSKVTALAQSQAVDIVGIGMENGNVIVHNVRLDETVMKFYQDWGPVMGISFRTDTVHTMVTSSSAGHIAVWDQGRRRLGTILRNAHHGAVTGLHFIQASPLLVTSGPDNSVKMWIFDQSDGSARLLRSRCGHNAPPTRIRFCSTGGDAVKILSGGLDHALRVFGLHKDVQMNMELSQGHLTKKSRSYGVAVEDLKLPAVTDFAIETARSREWDGVVSSHLGHTCAQTWNLQNCCIGKHALASKHAKQGARPQCVALSACGHFAVLGMNSGHVEVFNMQSGIHRGELGRPQAHSKAVRGVAVGALTMEVYSGSADRTVKCWSFPTKSLLRSIALDSAVASLQLHRDSSMLCVVCDDFSILIVDTDTRRIVRTFRGHSNRVTDTTFSPDGRWLLSSAMDCSIRTWDLPTGRLLDIFLVEAPPTSVALSPSGDFLCTTHVDDLGIYLWSNRTLYSHVSLRPLPSDHTPSVVALPNTAVSCEEEARNEETEEADDRVVAVVGETTENADSDAAVEGESTIATPVPLAEGLITLSNLPESRWRHLQEIDVIKRHNKPKDPPKQPKQAPFFLPTVSGLLPKFSTASAEESGEMPSSGFLEGAGSKILNLGALVPLSEFQKTLLQCSANVGDYEVMMDLLKSLPPAAIDGEVRGLSPDNGGSLEWLQRFMQCLLNQLKTGMNFELVESYLGLFLKLHSGVVSSHPVLLALLQQLLDAHTHTWSQLQSELDTSACLLGYFRSATV